MQYIFLSLWDRHICQCMKLFQILLGFIYIFNIQVLPYMYIYGYLTYSVHMLYMRIVLTKNAMTHVRTVTQMIWSAGCTMHPAGSSSLRRETLIQISK